jgi:23S rRNA (guanosine2251-2'-O)-methyltransferase
MANRPTRAGAVRKTGKGPTVGTGGHGRKALEGRGPTPKAEDRTYHPAGKRKARVERAAEKGRPARGPELRGNSRVKAASDGGELVAGRNSVLEALRAKIPATALYVAARVEMDDRVREIISIANKRSLPVMEIMRPELERMVGSDTVHQGVAITFSMRRLQPVTLHFSSPSTALPTLVTSVPSSGQPQLLAAMA